IVSANGRTLADVGDRSAIAAAGTQLLARGGAPVGRLEVSTTSARTYAARIKQVTMLDAALRQGGLPLASTDKTPARPLPGHGTVAVRGTEFRVASFNAPGFGPAPV